MTESPFDEWVAKRYETLNAVLYAPSVLGQTVEFLADLAGPGPVLGETRRVFAATADHIGYEEYDVAAQIAYSHHWWTVEGEIHRRSAPFRYLWPGELDLMARIAGLSLCERWADWERTPFTGDSRGHVSVWEKLA